VTAAATAPMPLPDLLPIRPFTRPARGEAPVPGSKSITNRALLLAALCDRPVTLTGALFSEDTRIMAEALVRLGIPVALDEATRSIRIEGRGGAIPGAAADIQVGNAGTAARFLTALCAAAPAGLFRIDGIPQMRTRPMKGLIEALRSLGADIRCTAREGFFPVEIRARGLRGGAVRIDAGESSQILSALLMVAPLAAADVTIELAGTVREPFVAITRAMMGHFGASVQTVPGGERISRRPYSPGGAPGAPARYPIEPDATAASYFLALPLVTGGEISVPGLGAGVLQGDIAFVDVLRRAGLSVSEKPFLVARNGGGARRGVEQDFSPFSDTFLTLAAISPLLSGPTRIIGIAHTRRQETDRVAGMARELRRLGQEVVEAEDSLEIHPRPLLPTVAPTEIETYGDHRFAMSFGILGCLDLRGDGLPWLAIRNPACCAKTFPNFFDLLEKLRRESSGSDAR